MNTEVKIAGVAFKNPVMTASGTFGSGMEYSDFVDLNRLGAVVTKGVANVPWEGNPTPRVAEVYGGMLNAIGLQNPGIDVFMERDLPFLQKYDTKVIVNVCGKTVSDYLEVVERLSDTAVKPVALRMVYQTAQAVKIPIIGMGGIGSGEDAVEFLLAGATAVAVGAMNFVNPYATVEVVEGIESYMKQYDIENVTDLIGAVE